MTTEVDDFEKAFEEAVKGDPVEVAPPAGDEKVETPAPVEKPDPDEKVETPAGGEKPEKTAEEIAAEEAAAKAAADAAKAAEETAARIKAEATARVEAETAARAEVDRKATETAAAAAAAQAAKDAADAKLKPYEPSDAEKAAMATFEKEFPNEYTAMQARLKQQNQALTGEMYQAIAGALKDIDARVDAKIAERMAPVESDRHVATIAAAHKDYEEIVALMPEWIAKQPGFVRKRYQEVYDNGSAAEIVEMITTIKKDTGRLEAAPPKDEKPVVKKPSAEEIASGAPINTKRVAPSERGGPDANNYDAAWEEASK